jgi:hypothetical protein
MKKQLKRLLTKSIMGRALLLPYRIALTYRAGLERPLQYVSWLLRSGELDNFSYELTQESIDELLAVTARVSGCSDAFVGAIRSELDGVGLSDLRRHLAFATRSSEYRWAQDCHGTIDQRLIYYALVRALKPRVVFQSGTSRGVGACLISAALQRNGEGGASGCLISTDIDAEQGYVVSGPYAANVEIVYKDSVTVLMELRPNVDLYIHDTGPGDLARHEMEALSLVRSPRTVVLSSWDTLQLRDFARRWKCSYVNWKDQPARHWYHGVNMGIICASDRK